MDCLKRGGRLITELSDGLSDFCVVKCVHGIQVSVARVRKPRVSKGETRNLSDSPLLTRGLAHPKVALIV